MPLTNSIRRAFEAGTRDRSGRPGSNYWQIQTDYAIDARLDPATDTITGSETITLHNNSPEELTQIFLRLDHNIYRSLVPRGHPDQTALAEPVIAPRHQDSPSRTRAELSGTWAGMAAAAGAETAQRRRPPPERRRAGMNDR